MQNYKSFLDATTGDSQTMVNLMTDENGVNTMNVKLIDKQLANVNGQLDNARIVLDSNEQLLADSQAKVEALTDKKQDMLNAEKSVARKKTAGGVILGGAIAGGIAYSWVKQYEKDAPPKSKGK